MSFYLDEGDILNCFGDILYFKLTKRIIDNIRKYDASRYICILTDDISFFDENYKVQNKIITKYFDYKNHVLYEIDTNNLWNRYGLIPKLFHSFYTPFSHSMYLDVDMIFNNDFTFLWEKYYDFSQSILYAGTCDDNNNAPSSWHWGTIMDVIACSNINIPEFSGTFLVYDERLKGYINKYLKLILQNIDNWNIKSLYRDGIPEEIIYAIIFGLENIRPNTEIYYYIFHSGMCDAANKTIIDQYNDCSIESNI
jgi:hypothetical protein